MKDMFAGLHGAASRGDAASLLWPICATLLLTTPACSNPPSVAPPAPVGSSGMVIYKNPTTGAFETPPPPAAAPSLTPPQAARINTSQAGLVEVASPGGGAMIDLRGRFQNYLRATVTKDGHTIAADCTNDDGQTAR